MKTLQETFEYLEKFKGVTDSTITSSFLKEGNYGVSLNKYFVDIWIDLFGENDTSINLTFANGEKFVKFSGVKPLLPKKEDLEEALNYFLNLKTTNKQREIDRTKANIKELEERLKELEGE